MDNEENWKNSEVITIFANDYLESPKDAINETITAETVEVPAEEVAPVKPSFDEHLAAKLELEKESIANELRSVLDVATKDGNHKIALMIENALDRLYNLE